MTDKKRAALQAALERLEHLEFNKPHVRGTDDCHEDIIEEIRAVLDEDEDAPPRREWVPLTDEEIADAIRPLCEENESVLRQLIDFSMDEYRAIEQKLKEKNA